MRAAGAGSIVALALDLLMLSAGHPSLWQQMGLLGSFYDVQGRALLHGHLSVPAGSLSFEGFLIGGRTYMYFGPVPALLRLPVLLVTHALDGRLTQLSMLLALVVLLFSGARLHWRVRELVRPGEPIGAGERAATFTLALALGAGGVPLFLASWPVVYHEAALWGAALSVAAIDAILGVVSRCDAKRVAWAGLLALLAVNTRVSVGLGPIIALGLLAIAIAARSIVEARPGNRLIARPLRALAALGPTAPQRGGRMLSLLVVAAALALGSAVALNEAKFHSAFTLPLAKQLDTRVDPNQRAYLAANHGSLVGLQFLPTTLLAVVRPDAVGSVRAFPFIGLPHSPPTVIGSARFNALLPSLSAFTSMPLFCLLLLAGLPALVALRRRPTAVTPGGGAQIGPLIGPLIATAAAFFPALIFGSIATRYLADLLPFLWLGACAGLQALLAGHRFGRATGSAVARRAAGGAIALLCLIAIAVNGSVGLVQQRLLAPTTSPATRASFVATQDDVDRFLGRKPQGVHSGARLPARPPGPAGDLFVLGRCAGLYVEGLGGAWLPVERGDRSGLHELSVRFPTPRSMSAPQPLLTLGAGPRRVAVLARGVGRSIVFSVRVGGRAVASGPAVVVDPRRRTRVTVSIDPLQRAWFLSVQIRGVGTAVTAPVPYDRLAAEVTGSDPSEPRLGRFAGAVSRLPASTPVCHEVAGRAGLR